MKYLTTRAICEYIVFNKLKYLKSSKIFLLGISAVVIFNFILFKNYTMQLSENMILDYLLNITIIFCEYMVTVAILMHFHIKKRQKLILLNIKLLLHEVDLTTLDEAYKESKKQNIKDHKLLNFLQKYKKN